MGSNPTLSATANSTVRKFFPATHQTVNWYLKETNGPLMPPGATNGNGTGNQTYVAASLALPEAPLTALLVVPGLAVAAAFVARRRRRGVVLA